MLPLTAHSTSLQEESSEILGYASTAKLCHSLRHGAGGMGACSEVSEGRHAHEGAVNLEIHKLHAHNHACMHTFTYACIHTYNHACKHASACEYMDKRPTNIHTCTNEHQPMCVHKMKLEIRRFGFVPANMHFFYIPYAPRYVTNVCVLLPLAKLLPRRGRLSGIRLEALLKLRMMDVECDADATDDGDTDAVLLLMVLVVRCRRWRWWWFRLCPRCASQGAPPVL